MTTKPSANAEDSDRGELVIANEAKVGVLDSY